MRSYLQGIYTPINPQKYIGNVDNIVFRSSYERKLMMKLDVSPDIVKWSSEELVIWYWDSIQKKKRRYFVDFTVLYKGSDGVEQKFAIEVKPYKETIPPTPPKNANKKRKIRFLNESMTYRLNQDKWNAAREWCRANGFKFVILHEKNTGGLFK